MKTAISLPDAIFRAADRLASQARESRKSRSDLYTDALTDYLARHTAEEITAAMNAVVDCVGEIPSDAFHRRAPRRMIARSEW